MVAGASGAIGIRLVPQLIDAGHEVIGKFRSPGGAERVRGVGAQPLALDLLDRDAVIEDVVARKPDAIVHRFGAELRERALRAHGRNGQDGDDPLDPQPVAATSEATAALRYLDEAVTAAGGIVLRYGVFYGADSDGLVEPVRKPESPIECPVRPVIAG